MSGGGDGARGHIFVGFAVALHCVLGRPQSSVKSNSLARTTVRLAYRGLPREVVAELGEMARLEPEHSSATSRARADLLLPPASPSGTVASGLLGCGRSQIVEARVLIRKVRCVLRLRQRRAQMVPGMPRMSARRSGASFSVPSTSSTT